MTFSGIKKLGGPVNIAGRIVKAGAIAHSQSKTSNRSSFDDKLPNLGKSRQSGEKVNNKLNVGVDISKLNLTSNLFMKKQEKQHRVMAMENGVPIRIRGANIMLGTIDSALKMSRSALAAQTARASVSRSVVF